MSQPNPICHLFLGDVQIGNSSIINEVLIALCNRFPRDAVWQLGWVFLHGLPQLLRPGPWTGDRTMGHPTAFRVPSCPHGWVEEQSWKTVWKPVSSERSRRWWPVWDCPHLR